MRKLSLILLVLAFPLTTAFMAQTPQKEATATIAGVVTLNGEPARGVSVTLQMQNPTPLRPSPPNAKTDANGRFRITGVAAGPYVIGAIAPGFVTGGNNSSRPSYGLQGKTLYISAGDTIENLELPLKRGCIITGRITDSNGEPVVEIYVRLTRVYEKGVIGQPPQPVNNSAYHTDDRGVYRIFGLPAGKYKVSVGVSTREGFPPLQSTRAFIPETFHPDTTDEAQAGIIELEDGQEATGVDIKTTEAKRAYEISGRVVDANGGKPLAGLSLTIGTYGKDGRLNGGWSSTAWHSEATGEFQFTGVLPGRHAVFIDNREGKSELHSDPTPVEVIDGNVSGVEIRAQLGASVNGTVAIEGTTDSTVLAKRSQVRLNISADPFTHFGLSRNARVNADGSFHLGGVPAGKFRFSSYSSQLGFSLLRVERNGEPLINSTVEIRPGEQLKGIRVVLGYGNAVVRGQVKIIGGTLPDGVRLIVNLRRVGGPTIYYQDDAPVDERGRFFAPRLMPGDYELKISYSTPGPLPRESVAQIQSAISKSKQTVSATNGAAAEVAITIDLGQEKN
ncbi:MAG: carboxypeptidase-like regulatory domain-containing protein [Acidobacteriota bacterium]|nr:carboxypeptidase-like regulatory domain-containing protein [Acidobacteriota bacterium]